MSDKKIRTIWDSLHNAYLHNTCFEDANHTHTRTHTRTHTCAHAHTHSSTDQYECVLGLNYPLHK